ncbi:phosphatidylcholine synthase [Afifella sp. IM 167]|nr:phosphatidylcholine synthase [Afifella sp. IM 167]
MGASEHRDQARRRASLFLIHLLTASGAALALLATLSASQGNWRACFIWLGIALVVDALDGPIARKYDVGTHLPRWDGSALDFVIDYTTYVFVPAIILASGCGLGTFSGILAAGVVAVTGALYFADTRMKEPDNSFRGFPAAWNLAVFVIFAMRPEPWMTLLVTALLAVATFLPINFVHPVRVTKWRTLTLVMMVVWMLAATILLIGGFGDNFFAETVLLVASFYLLCVAGVQQLLARL